MGQNEIFLAGLTFNIEELRKFLWLCSSSGDVSVKDFYLHKYVIYIINKTIDSRKSTSGLIPVCTKNITPYKLELKKKVQFHLYLS